MPILEKKEQPQKDIKLTLDAQLLEEDQVINQRHELETLGVTKVPLLKIPKINDFYKLSYESK
jgi:hypothetical protein